MCFCKVNTPLPHWIFNICRFMRVGVFNHSSLIFSEMQALNISDLSQLYIQRLSESYMFGIQLLLRRKGKKQRYELSSGIFSSSTHSGRWVGRWNMGQWQQWGPHLLILNPIEAPHMPAQQCQLFLTKLKCKKKNASVALFPFSLVCCGISDIIFVTVVQCIKCPLNFISSLSAYNESWVTWSRTPSSVTAWPCDSQRSALTPSDEESL